MWRSVSFEDSKASSSVSRLKRFLLMVEGTCVCVRFTTRNQTPRKHSAKSWSKLHEGVELHEGENVSFEYRFTCESVIDKMSLSGDVEMKNECHQRVSVVVRGSPLPSLTESPLPPLIGQLSCLNHI
jgi:hypothetical protein